MKCKNCGATLTFVSATGKLECRSCDSVFDPNDPELKRANGDYAEEHTLKLNINNDQTQDQVQTAAQENEINYKQYICKSCGAELVGTYDSSAIGFCSYCGGENIISSKIQAKRPDRITPFSRTKEECKKIYLDTVKKLLFVPKELKDEKFIDEIRGIYIPYNIYCAQHEGSVLAELRTSDASYNYEYGVSGDVSSSCWVPVDGSVQLDDYIGVAMYSYNESNSKDFNENYVATNYVELSDVDELSYSETVIRESMNCEMNALGKQLVATKSDVSDRRDKEEESKKFRIPTVIHHLSPMYFLTYRNNDKVCYTTISGDKNNNNVYAEIPVDIKQYSLVLALMTIALWAIASFISFIPTLPHNTVLLIISILSVLGLLLINREYKQQETKDNYLNGAKKLLNYTDETISIVALIACLFFGLVGIIPKLLILALSVFLYVRVLKRSNGSIVPHLLFVGCCLMSLFGVADSMLSIPDEVLYISMSITLVLSSIGFISIIRVFNENCERELPHFTREGGHNEARDL